MDFVDKFVDYLRSAKAELEKVTWPSRQDTIRYSTLVVVVSVALAVFFGFMDQSLIKGVEAVLSNRPITSSAPRQPTTSTTVPEFTPVDVQTVTTTPTVNTITPEPIDLNATPPVQP